MPHLTTNPTRWRIVATTPVAGKMQPVGSVVIKKERDSGAFSVWSLSVDAHHRRHGVATAMMRECHKLADANPVWLYVRGDNTAAIALYTKLGYTKTDDLPDGRICMTRLARTVTAEENTTTKQAFWLGVVLGCAIMSLLTVFALIIL